MTETELTQEILQRIAKLETLIESKLSSTDERLRKLESQQEWLWRTIIGAVIGGAMAFYFK